MYYKYKMSNIIENEKTDNESIGTNISNEKKTIYKLEKKNQKAFS